MVAQKTTTIKRGSGCGRRFFEVVFCHGFCHCDASGILAVPPTNRPPALAGEADTAYPGVSGLKGDTTKLNTKSTLCRSCNVAPHAHSLSWCRPSAVGNAPTGTR